jgi:hypothetical protein
MLASDVGSWRIGVKVVPDPEGHDPQRNCKLKNKIILATKTDKETKVVEVGETDGDIKEKGDRDVQDLFSATISLKADGIDEIGGKAKSSRADGADGAMEDRLEEIKMRAGQKVVAARYSSTPRVSAYVEPCDVPV